MAKKAAVKPKTTKTVKAPTKQEEVVFFVPDLIKKVAEESEYTGEAVKEICTDFVNVLRDTIYSGNAVNIQRLGKLFIKDMPARKARNPITGESIQVEAKRALRFKASTVVKKAINE